MQKVLQTAMSESVTDKNKRKDWEKKEAEKTLKNAANKTDDELSEKITALTTLSKDELAKICPEKGDTKKLAQLIQIVKSAESQNEKINRIVSNSEKFFMGN